MTARLVKFSEAINSMCSNWRRCSFSMAAATSGSADASAVSWGWDGVVDVILGCLSAWRTEGIARSMLRLHSA